MSKRPVSEEEAYLFSIAIWLEPLWRFKGHAVYTVSPFQINKLIRT